MKIAVAHKFAAAALLLCAALTGCPQGGAPQDAQAPTPAPDTAAPPPLPIAVQLYTLRSMPSLEDRLKAVQDAGVSAVELVGTMDTSADELNALLGKYSLSVTSMHVSLDSLQNDLDALAEFNHAVGSSVIVLPWLVPEKRPTDAAGWVALGEEIGQVARAVEAKGQTLAYHNHDFEMAIFDGKTGLELLFDAAGPALKAEIDVAWVARGGQDPASYLNQFAGRIYSIHAKDNAPEGQGEDEGGFAAVGSGVLDWAEILPASVQAGVKWYIIEHDLPLDPPGTIKISADYLRTHLPASLGQ